jgi:hypothetical protein
MAKFEGKKAGMKKQKDQENVKLSLDLAQKDVHLKDCRHGGFYSTF